VPVPWWLHRLLGLVRRGSATGRWVAGPALRGKLCAVYLPAHHRPDLRTPLLLLLHGCDQDAEAFVDATRFTTVADRHGIVLVAPEQLRRHHPSRCWRWYQPRHQERGGGEPAALAGVAAAMLAERARWRIDPRRVYVAGISAGGAMALTLAATYPDVFAGVGVHSAPPYRSATGVTSGLAAMRGRGAVPVPAPDAPPMPPLVVVQGQADQAVSPGNGPRVAAQWLAYHRGPPPRAKSAVGTAKDGRTFRTTRWFVGRRRVVLAMWLVDDLGHAWSGGRPGGSYSDPAGPPAAVLMWRFLRRHRRDAPNAAPP
jgi:poly(hydroxyalkanoate) depolymerase family esterase